MNIKKKGNNFVITIPIWSSRSNPYMPNQNVGRYPTLTGLVNKDKYGNEECGLAQTIDMDYKDKADQYTEIKYHWWEEQKEFEEKCKELGIDIVYLTADKDEIE